jgi:hypothetical protein
MAVEPEPAEKAEPPIVPRVRGWLAPLFFLAGFGLVPWTLYLFATLPGRHLQTGYYDLAWGGFDLALASLFVATGVGLLGRRLWVQSTATATATMLVCDAWFDIVTSGRGADLAMSLASGIFIELPLAIICVWVARNAERAQDYFAAAGGRLTRRRARPR